MANNFQIYYKKSKKKLSKEIGLSVLLSATTGGKGSAIVKEILKSLSSSAYDRTLEKEADIMGARALQMKPFSLSDYRTEKSVQKKGVVQKAPKKSSKEKEWDTAKSNAKEMEEFNAIKMQEAYLIFLITEKF